MPVHNMKTHRGVGVLVRSFLSSALDGDEWSVLRFWPLAPGKEPWYPLNTRLGRPQNRSGRIFFFAEEKKSFATPPGFESRTVQPVASRYTD